MPRASKVVVNSPFYARLECDACTGHLGIVRSGRQNVKPTDGHILMPSSCEYAAIGQKGIMVADRFKVANQLTLHG